MFPLHIHLKNGVAEKKNRTLIKAARTMLSRSVFSKQYWTEAVAIACYTQNRSTIAKRHLKTPYEVFRGRIPNIDFLHPSEFSTPEDNKLKKPITSHLIKASMLSNSQNLQLMISTLLNQKDIHLMNIFIHMNLYKDDLNDQNDHPVQADEILNDDQLEHSNHNNDNHIIDNLLSTKDIQIIKPLSSPTKDTSAPIIVSSIQTESPSSIPSMAFPAPQDRWSKDKHIKLVNIIGNPGARLLTRAMAKELIDASAHECLFVDFLSDEETKKVSKALKHPGWVDAMQ
ncbi:retrovirus-related pol polyprotein from transposon TNT 1-94 [Tanacetum coccineum]